MADGTNVFEPESGTSVDSTEVDFGFGDVRDRQRMRLAGAGPSDDVPVLATKPTATDNGLVVRTAGLADVAVSVDGSPVSEVNPLPTRASLFDESGQVYGETNRLPVDIGSVSVQASFESVVSAGNTTQVPLGPNEVFIGPWEEVTDYASISISIFTDAGTPMDGAKAQFSSDGVNVITEAVTTLGPSGGSAFFSVAPQARFFRAHYTNGPVAQTVLRSEITYHFNAQGPSLGPIGGPTDDRSVAQVTKASLHGRHSSGFWAALRSTIDGILSVNVENTVRQRGETTTNVGTLRAAAQANAVQLNVEGPGRTVVQIAVPEGHASSQVFLSGVFSANSRVFFEGSADGTDGSWFLLNHRRSPDSTTNDQATLLDSSPTGGVSPLGAGVSNWRGALAGVRFFRVRCGAYAPGDAIAVQITTSTALGATFTNAAPPMSADNFKSGVLTAPGQTVEVNANGGSGWASFMVGQFTGAIFFEASINGTDWDPINGAVQGVGTLTRTFIGTGQVGQRLIVRGGAGGLSRVRLRAGSDFSGSMSGEIRVGAGTGGVFLTAPVPIAGLSAGAQTGRRSVGTSATQLDPVALPVRTSVEILYQANGAATGGVVYVGFSPAVSTGSGRALQPGESWTLDVTSSVPIYAVATAADQQVQITELG